MQRFAPTAVKADEIEIEMEESNERECLIMLDMAGLGKCSSCLSPPELGFVSQCLR